ncbi:unnamed protein product [Pipistrellus nathusii]|uniref:Uncharacterized protein n=1 Tax=Pipistrellus nathusii TaxID=59473 RepID=A0ABN9ZIZ4_PIPNA
MNAKVPPTLGLQGQAVAPQGEGMEGWRWRGVRLTHISKAPCPELGLPTCLSYNQRDVCFPILPLSMAGESPLCGPPFCGREPQEDPGFILGILLSAPLIPEYDLAPDKATVSEGQ